MEVQTKPHAILLASPGMGHLIPMIELANRLTTNHGFHVTIFVVSINPNVDESSLLQDANNNGQTLHNVVVLPYVDSSAQIAPTDKIMTRLAIMMRAYIPLLRDELESMDHNPTLIVADLFGTEFLKLADEFDMLKYVYIASNAWFLAETIYVSVLDKNVKLEGPLNIPGCKRVEYDDLLSPVFDPENRDYDEYVRIGVEIREADGVLVNTWEDLEPTTLFALRNNEILRKFFDKPVYPVGPVTRPARSEDLAGKLFDWLDDQPSESVLYVSFGSGGTLSSQQTMELAWGLELSEQRFVWVVRPPIDHDGAGALFNSIDGHDRISSFLPDGFLTRTQEVGRVVTTWVAQVEILAHPSIGGFVSHCGWNSVLESLVNGVPLIAWPLYAEQNMNATLLVEEIGVAIRTSVLPSKGVVDRAEIEKTVRKIMVGNGESKVRHRVKEVQEQAKKAMTMKGSSSKSLAQVANNCEIRLNKQNLKS